MNSTTTEVISEIESDIRATKENTSLFEEINFDARADAIDFIDFHIIERIAGMSPNIELDVLKQRAEKVKSELEKIDANLFRQLREKIRAGSYIGASFKEMICKYMRDDDIGLSEMMGYDNLDVFINGLLSDDAIPSPTMEREPEMVFYQKTPARIIFGMIEQAQLKPGDVFFDLGSGLGQVAILANLISGATVKGVEYEPAYCNYAMKCTLDLNLSGIEFINADARYADYSQGNVFFLYTPFEGDMLQDALNRLQQESRKRTIRVFTYGPCSSHVACQAWLICLNGKADDPYQLCGFRSLYVS